MKKPQESEYLKAMRVVADQGPDAQGFGMVARCKELYDKDVKVFMERLHDLEREHSRSTVIWEKAKAEAQAKAPAAARGRDLDTDKVIEICRELAANWKDD